MNKIWLVIKREYLSRVKKKSFIITTLLIPFMFVGMSLIMGLIAAKSIDDKKIAVIDESGWIAQKLESAAKMTFVIHQGDYESLKEEFKADGYNGILFIPSTLSTDNTKGIEYFSKNQIGVASKTLIQRKLNDIIESKRISEAGYDQETIAAFESNISITNKVAGDDGEDKSVSSEISTALGFAMGMLIYMTLLVYGAMVMKGVMEEKTNRIVEVMISSIKPFQMMLGKIVGIGAVGLTQFLLWGILAAVIYPVAGLIFAETFNNMEMINEVMESSGSMADVSQFDPDDVELTELMNSIKNMPWIKLIFSFIFYFFGGYLLYSSLFAAVGSAMDDDSEANTLTLPIMLPIIISIFIMMMTMDNPHSSLAVWGSIIPFSSPIVMLARIPFDVPAWQLILSMVLLIAGFIATVWIAGKIYRTGILMYGKKVTLKDFGKWIVGNG